MGAAAVSDIILSVARTIGHAAAGRRLCYAQVWIGGWAGVHENPHGCCVLTTLDLPSVMTADAAAAATSQGKGATFARQLFQTVRSKAQCS